MAVLRVNLSCESKKFLPSKSDSFGPCNDWSPDQHTPYMGPGRVPKNLPRPHELCERKSYDMAEKRKFTGTVKATMLPY